MKIKNIWKDVEEPLELHTDDRGSIVDVFYNDELSLYTARHYTDVTAKELLKGKEVILEQKSRNTLQIVVK